MVHLPLRRSIDKPRKTGLTVVVDFGEPMELVDSYLGMAHRFIDLWKIAVGSARLYEEKYFLKKLDLLKHNRVSSFIGGQFMEYVFATQGWGGLKPFFEESKRLGITTLEVSDNCVPLQDEERERMIRMVADAGFLVHGEVGSKDFKQPANELIRQANICIEAGCEFVLVEAAELFIDGKVQTELVTAIHTGFDPKRLMIELPGFWIKSTTQNVVFEMMKFLVSTFGPDANIANVPAHQVMMLESLRTGLGVVGPYNCLDPDSSNR